MSQQTQIVAAVAKRGYMDGWSDDQLAARQIVKLVEEVGELASTVETDDPQLGYFIAKLVETGHKARQLFDMPDLFAGATVHSGPAAHELTDVQVVSFVMAHALGMMDLPYSAQCKAEADASRGVRA